MRLKELFSGWEMPSILSGEEVDETSEAKEDEMGAESCSESVTLMAVSCQGVRVALRISRSSCCVAVVVRRHGRLDMRVLRWDHLILVL